MSTERSASVAGVAPEALRSRVLAIDWQAGLRSLWAQSALRWLTVVLVVALAVRIVWVVAVQPDPRDGRFDDTVWYYYAARHLAQGDGYVFPGDAFCRFGDTIGCDELPPTALWAPGYPLTLAALFQLPGDDVAWARALNVAAGLALVAGVYYLGARLWRQRAGLLAAAITALFPSQIFFSSLVLSESLFAALAVGLLCLALAWTMGREAAPWRVFAVGVAAGALAMVRPEGLIFAGVIVLAWLAVRPGKPGRAVAYTGLLAAGILVLVIPWSVRNAIQLDAPVFGTTGLGQVLIQAHHPEADGYPEYWIASDLWNRYSDVALPEREVRVNSAGIRESFTYAREHPGRELELMPQRFAAFYRGDRGALIWNRVPDGAGAQELSASAADRLGLLSDVYYYAVIGVGLIGLPFWLRRVRGQHTLLAGPILVYSVMWALLFTGEARYHLPLLPVFALVAAIGLAAITERVWARRD